LESIRDEEPVRKTSDGLGVLLFRIERAIRLGDQPEILRLQDVEAVIEKIQVQDVPARHTPMQTVALPGTVLIFNRRGTPVSRLSSIKSRMSAFMVFSMLYSTSNILAQLTF
jgi:hypothetical protein